MLQNGQHNNTYFLRDTYLIITQLKSNKINMNLKVEDLRVVPTDHSNKTC